MIQYNKPGQGVATFSVAATTELPVNYKQCALCGGAI